MIQRYKCWSHDDEGGRYNARRTPNANGDYVLYTDHVAELQARFPVVHDLRKDPSDLPDNCRFVLLGYAHEDESLSSVGMYFAKKWVVDGGRCATVIGWQELPTWEDVLYTDHVAHAAVWCGVPTVHDLRKDPSDLPDSGVDVVGVYLTCCGTRRTVICCYLRKFASEDIGDNWEDDDLDWDDNGNPYLPQGWYVYTHGEDVNMVLHNDIIAWQDLPTWEVTI